MSPTAKLMDATRTKKVEFSIYTQNIHAWPTEEVNSHTAIRYYNRERHDTQGPAVSF
jgi:hypothetical protein